MDRVRMQEFEELVLLAVMAAGEGAYGITVQRTLEEELGFPPSLGAVYTALNRLLQKGWLSSEMGAPTPVRGGRKKRHYGLTEEGLARVRETRRIRQALWARSGQTLVEGGAEG